MSEQTKLFRDYFQIGDHVLLTTEEDGLVGGFLCDFPPDEGVLLRLTHTVQPVPFEVEEGLAREIERAVMRTPEWRQKLILTMMGRLDSLRKTGVELQTMSAIAVVEGLRSDHAERGAVALTEMQVPVLTQYSFGTYSKMTLTSDHNLKLSVEGLDQELFDLNSTEAQKPTDLEEKEKDEDGSV